MGVLDKKIVPTIIHKSKEILTIRIITLLHMCICSHTHMHIYVQDMIYVYVCCPSLLIRNHKHTAHNAHSKATRAYTAAVPAPWAAAAKPY